MSVVDPGSGLFNEDFFQATFDKRVAAAKRQLTPLSLVLLRVARSLDAEVPNQVCPLVEAQVMGPMVLETLRDADVACLLDDGCLALILDLTDDLGAMGTVERLRQQVDEHLVGAVLWAGVASYPAHAFDAHSLLAAADAALVRATDWNQHRIDIAPPAPD